MLSRTCPRNAEHFLHPSQKYCKECGAGAVIRDRYTCIHCGWSTWNPNEHRICPLCGAPVFEPALGMRAIRASAA